MKRTALLFVAIILAGCACQSDYFHPCHRMTWEEMCRGEVACRTCLREDSGRGDREEAAHRCWDRINGKDSPV